MKSFFENSFFYALQKVYKKPLYWFITLSVALLYLLVAIWIPQWSLIHYTFTSPYFSVAQKIHIYRESLGWFFSGNTTISQLLTLCTALLVGVNTALLAYYVSLRIRFQRVHGVGVFALIFGVLGVGCGACGSVILSSIFGLTVATGITGVLPLKGLEFSLLSIVILLGSIVYLARSMQRPLTCNT